MARKVACVVFVLFAALACGGTMDGPWGFCASHHDRTSCKGAGCVWNLAPKPDSVCANPIDDITPLASEGCFKGVFYPWRDRLGGCLSDSECPASNRCIAKSFLHDDDPTATCDYAMLCVPAE